MFILSTIILLVLLIVSCIALTVWLHRTTGELDEVNTRFDLVVAESERLRTQAGNILTLNEVLTSEKDRAFRRMRKAENLLAEYRRQGYTEYDYEALRSDYANLKAEYDTRLGNVVDLSAWGVLTGGCRHGAYEQPSDCKTCYPDGVAAH